MNMNKPINLLVGELDAVCRTGMQSSETGSSSKSNIRILSMYSLINTVTRHWEFGVRTGFRIR